jgi:transposase-like protein
MMQKGPPGQDESCHTPHLNPRGPLREMLTSGMHQDATPLDAAASRAVRSHALCCENNMQSEQIVDDRADEEGAALSPESAVADGIEAMSTPSIGDAPVAPARRRGRRRRRLSPDQQREVARLYAEASLPTSEIRRRFGIGESSLYRIVQRQGVQLRGRGPSLKQSGPAQARASDVRRRDGAGTGRAGGGPTSRGSRTQTTPARGQSAGPQSDSGRQRFRVTFQRDAVVEAENIREALRQAESLGATEVLRIVREV